MSEITRFCSAADEIIEAMQAVIDANVIISSGGIPVMRQTAKLINTEKVEIAVA